MRNEASELGQINLPEDLSTGYRYLQSYGNKPINLPPWEQIVASREALKSRGVSEESANEIIRNNLIERAQGARGEL